MNALDDAPLDETSFAFKDIRGQDRWETWSPVYSFATATSLTVIGRFRVVGKQCFAQVKSSGTSLATTGGTSYIELPIAATGLGGLGVMSDDTANTTVGTGHIDVANSRFYPPTQAASGDTFTFAFWWEIE